MLLIQSILDVCHSSLLKAQNWPVIGIIEVSYFSVDGSVSLEKKKI